LKLRNHSRQRIKFKGINTWFQVSCHIETSKSL
jgi:hypothetical protein